ALIRAREPIDGIDLRRERRGLERLRDLCSGPGKLTQALGIGLDRNGGDLATGPVTIEPPPPGRPAPTVTASPRIGITRAMELPWRFCVTGSPHVSSPRPRP
ncbi:MAG TPA: DNA-3-methyladenine glycosylase, partial [Solirubrobacteraceae bacterium]|nr:DNA-3-methyladenine glycosylase [Solirubrobacteraceae bacterium]